jgi:PelA/Pel-15E family pectate lyase
MAATAVPAAAVVIGHMTPPPSLTVERLRGLPPATRNVWIAYIERSSVAMARDRSMLASERQGLAVVPAPPPEGRTATMPLDRDAAWYSSTSAGAIADNIVSFETPTGGWGKNQDRSAPPRVPGQMYIPFDSKAGAHAASDLAGGWSFIGTLDNDATTTELSFLARVQVGRSGADGERYRSAFLKGIRYLLEAELPSGGWPQVYPLQGGYHDALTLNDDTMIKATALLQRTAAGDGDYAFVPVAVRTAARGAVVRSMATLLTTQVVIHGRRTIWAQQYDPVTLQPVGARHFEPIALATTESAAVLRFLMQQGDPSPAIRRAITDGARWFATHAIRDRVWAAASSPEGRRLIEWPGAGPIWARFYDPVTQRPIFGDRDRSIQDDINTVSRERRNGYSWFSATGVGVSDAYAKWSRREAVRS